MNTSIQYTRSQTLLYYITFCAIFVLSFVLYSPYYNIRFSSDHAVHVLMAQDLQLPDDLYYWGQNRLGSLVPILANWLHKGLGMDAMFATTLVHFGFLLGTALLACRYLKKHIYKLLFVALWLLPLPQFKEHLFLGHPYAPQLFLLFLGMYLQELQVASLAGKVLLSFMGALLMLLSCWVSELSFSFIACYYLLSGLHFFVNRKNVTLDRKLLMLQIATTVVAFVSTGLFIVYAKAHAAESKDYAALFAPPKIWGSGVAKHAGDFLETVTHITDAPFKGLYAITFGAILLLLTFLLFRQRLIPVLFPDGSRNHALLFFLTGFGGWILLYSLHWTNMYGSYDYKYWTFSCFFIFLFLLMMAERTAVGRRILTIAFFLLLLIQLRITWIYATDKTSNRWESDFSYSELKQYKQLGNCGLIADYWFSYVLACADPENIVATPHDKNLVRNPRYITEVLRKKTLYLVQNRWLEQWPGEITQFGHRLVKAGEPFRIERASFCRYEVAENSK